NLQAANSSYRFAGSFGFNYLLSKKMSLNTIAGVTFNKVRENSFIPNLGITSDTLATAIGYNQAAASVQRLFSVYNDTWLSYNHNLNANNNLSANAGVRFNSSDAEYD